METLSSLALLFPLALTSGVNLYATVLVAGLSIRYGGVQLPPALDVLQSWPVIILAGTFFVMEFLADKVPAVTQIWDFFHTFIRPLGMAALGILLLNHAEPLLVILTTLALGSVTLVTHVSKAGSRLAVDLTVPGGNLLMSLVEDVFAGGMAFFALRYPLLASAIALVIFIGILIVAPLLMRWAWFTITSLFAWLRSLFGKLTHPEALPAEYWQALHNKVPEMVVRCKAQNIKGANGRTGYLVKIGPSLAFVYKAWFSVRVWRLDARQIFAGQFHPRFLLDTLEVHYRDVEHKKRLARFVFQRDRQVLAQNLMTSLRNRA